MGEDYVVERTVGPAIAYGYRGARSSRGVYQSARGLAQYRGMSSAQIGSEWFHSVADRSRAVHQLNTDFQVLTADLAATVTAHPTPAAAQWLSADVTPTLKAWSTFAQREIDSWLTRAATDWEAFEDWSDRLRRLRELARSHGIALTSPEPADLPKTVWDRAASGHGDEVTSWLGVGRVAMLGALGVAGVYGLFTLWRDIRRG
jgi:hypothetical protein